MVVIALRRSQVDLAVSRSYHQSALQREEALQIEIEDLKARVRQREKELFARRSEQSQSHSESQVTNTQSKRSRGQQKNNSGPKRRHHEHLDSREVFYDVPDEQKACPCCGLPFAEFPITEDSEQLEIEIRAYRRILKRKRYKKTCQCETTATMLTAPPPPKLIPKGKIGISLWVHLLLSKYLYYQPTYRTLAQLETQDLFLSQATITQGFETISPLMTPLYEALIEQQLKDTHWHADETRWMVFETKAGKSNYRWYLWVVQSQSAVIFIIDPSRSSQVVKKHFGEEAKGILSVDRYSAYKAMAKALDIVLSFCWAHVRRDFLKVAASRPEHENWGLAWVEKIGNLYHLNKTRLQFELNSTEFAGTDFQLRSAIQQMEKEIDQQLEEEDLAHPRKKILASLKNHWEGLTLFVKNPHVPMDNNQAESSLRGPVVARKNYNGSGSIKSAAFAAAIFSIFQSLKLYNINPHAWSREYLQACANAGGIAPQNFQEFLPWNLSDELKQKCSFVFPNRNSS